MNKNTPRYKDKIFVTDKKHILRTLNTYSKYQDVSKIYVIFNDECKKYQLLLEYESENKNTNNQTNIEKERKLVYERTNSKIKLNNEKTILSVVNSRITKDNLQPETIEALSKLIKKYNKASILNDFFEDDKENERIEKIDKILPADLKKEYSAGFQPKPFKTNIGKRIYYLIKNQLTYSSLNGLNNLEHTRKQEATIEKREIARKKSNIEKCIEDEMIITENNIKSLVEYSFYFADEYSASKWELISAIKNFDDPNYNKYNLGAWSFQELKNELNRMKINQRLMTSEEKLEFQMIKKFRQSIKQSLDTSYKREFEAYNSIIAFCKKKQLFLNDNSIKKYIKMVDNLYEEEHKKKTRIKKRRGLNKLDKQYLYLEQVRSKDDFYFRHKIFRLHKFILEYKDRYRFNIDCSYFKQLELIKSDMAQHLLKEGLATWASLEEDDKEERAERKFQRMLEEKGITEEEYYFNVFYKKLLNHIDQIMKTSYRPLTLQYFEKYHKLISNITKLKGYYEDPLSLDFPIEYKRSCRDIKEEISDYIDEIYEKIEEDLIAAGIDPNELADEDESSVDIEVEKAHLFEHLPENLRPLFIEVYKFNHRIKKDKIIEDDEEIPF